jgi:hypothetical protein
LDSCVFGAAITAAIATGFAAWFTHQQVGIAEDTAQRQLRAYLSVSLVSNALQNFGEGKVAHVQGKYENMGQTPAYKVKWQSGINVLRNTGTADIAYGDCSIITSSPEGSSGYLTRTPIYPDKDRPMPFSKGEIEPISAVEFVTEISMTKHSLSISVCIGLGIAAKAGWTLTAPTVGIEMAHQR